MTIDMREILAAEKKRRDEFTKLVIARQQRFFKRLATKVKADLEHIK